LFFVDRYNSQSNTGYYPEGQIYCCNPCGEQGIPPYAVCNLGHINLARFLIGDGVYEAASVDWDRLGKVIKSAMRFMDDVIDISYYPLPENSNQQKAERRIGLGTMGLAEVLIRCHVRYGNNPDCLQFLDRLYSFIAWNAYGASADLAEEKGAFPLYDADKIATRPFIRNLPQGLQTSIRKKGLRNAGSLTQAPTGTVGTMVGTSPGIEPFFRFEWLRNSRLGIHREYAKVYEEYLEAHPDLDEKRSGMSEAERGSSADFLPSWFVTTAGMTPEDHAYTQAAIQKWVDSSISKTSNVPNDYTADQVGSYYRLLYLLGCKGGTVYRDGSREEQVLNALGKNGSNDNVVAVQELRPVPSGIYDAKCASLLTPVGKLSTKLCLYPQTGEPFEVWLEVSKSGSEVNAIREAFARLMSLFLRVDSPVKSDRKVEMLIEQLEGLSGGNPVGFGPNRVLSLPDGIAKSLQMALAAIKAGVPAQAAPVTPEAPRSPEKPGKNGHRSDCDVCPSCHQAGFYRVEGCQKCDHCGFSKC
jgi:ribonucleoside-diphosphate reductase alpha chain